MATRFARPFRTPEFQPAWYPGLKSGAIDGNAFSIRPAAAAAFWEKPSTFGRLAEMREIDPSGFGQTLLEFKGLIDGRLDAGEISRIAAEWEDVRLGMEGFLSSI